MTLHGVQTSSILEDVEETSAGQPSSEFPTICATDDLQRPSANQKSQSSIGTSRPNQVSRRVRKRAEPVKCACFQCKKRKTKCSGRRPVCHFCEDRNLECSWDSADGLTRAADLKRQLNEAIDYSEHLGILVDAMRSSSIQISTMLLAKLRLGESLQDLIVSIQSMSAHVEDDLAIRNDQAGCEGQQWKGDYSIAQYSSR